MQNYQELFKDKKITVMGLGLLGRGVGDAIFLAECGAKLTITDLKTKEQLKESLDKLKKFKDIKYTLGEHKLEDFQKADLVLKSAGVPLDSIYIKEARKNNISVEMSGALLASLANLPVVGVTGTRGKSTTTHLVAHILETAGEKVLLGGNVRGVSNLQLLKKIKSADVIVLELDSWQLQGFGEAKISPHISVFTNFMPDHMNYYKDDMQTYFTDKSYIYKFQNKEDVLILGPQMKDLVVANSKIINANAKNISKSWKFNLKGQHNLENIACAVEVAKVLNVHEKFIKKALANFKSVAGRLELVRKYKNIDIYNDTNSTTPDATMAALNSFDKKVFLILGGMDKGIDVGKLLEILPKKTIKVFLTPGSGSDKIINKKAQIEKVENLKEAVCRAFKLAKKGDIIVFSPGFASFNMFKNEYDRGDQFVTIVKGLE